jgi:hypothetical protein
MELNGIANILAVAEMAKWDNKIDETTYNDILDQCDILERYMLAVRKAYVKGIPVPKWHQVRDFRHKFPTNKQG